MVWWEPAAQQSLAVVTKPHQTRPLTLCPPLPHPQASPQFPVPETLRPVTTEPLTPHPVAAGSPPKGPESCALLMEDKSPSGPGCPFTVSVPVRPPPPQAGLAGPPSSCPKGRGLDGTPAFHALWLSPSCLSLLSCL